MYGNYTQDSSDTRILPEDFEEKGSERNKLLKNGPLENRGCTDILCCIIFLAFWGVMGYVATVAI